MATAFSSSVSHGRKDSSTSLRRHLSNSTPLFKTITKDLCTGWLSPTSEKSSTKHDTQSTYRHKPRHAGRDAMKTTSPQEWKGSLEPCARDIDIRSRQDSLTPVRQADVGKLGRVGLVPDYSLDSWSTGWDIAYERRTSVLHGDKRRVPDARTSSTFTISEEQARDMTFGSVPKRVRSRSGGHLVSPAPSRRGSEVPSLVYSEEGSKASSLEELEEESEDEVEKDEETKRWGKVFETSEVVVAPTQSVVGKAAVVQI